MIHALVFDFDGLILDTEMPDFQSWHEMFEEHGCTLPREAWCAAIGIVAGEMPFKPLDLLETQYGRALDRETIRARRYRRYRELIEAENTLAGVEDLIADARQHGLKLGVASSSDRAWVEEHLARIGLLTRFDTIKTSDDVRRTKPEPDLYLAAVEALGVQPHEAVALEDSANGVTAAKRAGLYCVAVPHDLTRELPLQHADLRLNSLAEMPLTTLLATLEAKQP